jgi:hypothetical protein
MSASSSSGLGTSAGDSNDRLMKTIDAINASMGRGSITLGATLAGQEDGANGWTPRSNYISPPFTTSWNDLPIARTG